VALHKWQFRPSEYSPDELLSTLRQVPDLIGTVGGETNQVTRCQKTVQLLIQPASVKVTSMRSGQNSNCRPIGQSEGDLQPVLQEPFYDFMNELNGNQGFSDFSSFADELSTLFPGGL
jgi:hypothetical protein